MTVSKHMASQAKPKTIRKFRASGDKTIEEYMVESETTSTITVGYDNLLKKTVRYKKHGKEEAWFDTWEEAHAFLVAKMVRNVAHADSVARVWKQSQQELLALKPPAGKAA